MQTFKEVAARAAAQQNPQVLEVKQLLAPALVALRQLQRDYRDKKSEWLGRLATAQQNSRSPSAGGIPIATSS